MEAIEMLNGEEGEELQEIDGLDQDLEEEEEIVNMEAIEMLNGEEKEELQEIDGLDQDLEEEEEIRKLNHQLSFESDFAYLSIIFQIYQVYL